MICMLRLHVFASYQDPIPLGPLGSNRLCSHSVLILQVIIPTAPYQARTK